MMKILGVIVLLVVLLVGFIATRPNTYRVERSATIAAPAEVVQSQIEDFHAWKSWSPWEKLDPAMKTDFSGPDRGVGASYHWVGNDKVGEGRMTVTESVPGQKVGIRLEFVKPFASVNATTFTFAPDGAGTKTSWIMEGNHNFISKAMCLVKNMDSMIGPDFEKGLADLKTVSEQMPAPATEAAPAAADSTH